jgi:hypothetical protein
MNNQIVIYDRKSDTKVMGSKQKGTLWKIAIRT